MADHDVDVEFYDDESDAPRYRTHPKVVAGIVLMASLMLFSVLFTLTMMIMGAVAPPPGSGSNLIASPELGDYFTAQRMLVAGGISATLTFLFWLSIPE